MGKMEEEVKELRGLCVNQDTHIGRDVELLDDEGRWAGSLKINVEKTEEMTESGTERCELIVISAGYTFLERRDEEDEHHFQVLHLLHDILDKDRSKPSGTYGIYNVLWIEWHEGIAYRKALGWVTQEAWQRQPEDKIDVLLG
jgi:hypothetical protein